eukprot:m.631135 g.631135  ORF g.631135 m.631135 type:complete len:480 (-) comp58283_c0_seq22:2372-3811(-)
MRCNYTFDYVSTYGGSQTVLASASVEMCDTLGTPKQGHLALTAVDNEMTLTYVTGTTTTPSVRFGTEPNSLTELVNGTTSTYAASNMCNAPANITAQVYFRSPGYIHRVLLSGLAYSTTYYYKFGNDIDGWSLTYSFTSKPPPSTPDVSFIAYADMGIWSGLASVSTAVNVNEDIETGLYDFVLHHGDISYAMGNAYVWEDYFRIIESYATRVPYMVGIGNHEYDYVAGGQNDPSGAGTEGGHSWEPSFGNYGDDSGGECAVPMAARFAMPDTGNGLFWYSYDYGSIHVIMMSTEHNWTVGSEQYNWLLNDLQNINRTLTPWVVMAGHRMFYTTQLPIASDFHLALYFRQAIEDLLYKYEVNLFFDGHQHSFERTCQVYRNDCLADGTGTVFVTIGTAGASLESGGFDPALNFSIAHSEQWGYTRVHVSAPQIIVQYVLNVDGSVFDEAILQPWPDTPERRARVAAIDERLSRNVEYAD